MRNLNGPQWRQLFTLPEDPGVPLHARLRRTLVDAILDGRLPRHSRLPSSRELSRLLNVSRNTVSTAYMQLVSEGFLDTRSRSGVFVAVAETSAPAAGLAESETRSAQAPDWSRRVIRTLVDTPTLVKPARWRDYPFPFVYGHHDPTLFPVDEFRDSWLRSVGRAQLAQWAPDLETDDVPELVEQLRQKVLPKRGVFALPQEILITVGAQQAHYLIAEALLDECSRVGFEEPGYPHARNCFLIRRPQLVPLPVDGEGVVLDGWPDALDVVFVTPSQQCPTTATLPLERRQQLLAAANQRDFVIVEDDYEAENLYEGAPMPALKSMDRSGRVIYVGSISKNLSSGLRLGYIVASSTLIAHLRSLRHAMIRHPSSLLQHAYALFIADGHHELHSRRISRAMQDRAEVLAQALQRHLPGFDFALPQGGASVWVRAPQWVDGGELALAAREHGALIEPGPVFFQDPPQPCPYFRLRLSSVPAGHLEEGVKAIARAVADIGRRRGRLTCAPRPCSRTHPV